jgi:fido (protein-threonine AMPylation protein)
MITSHRFLYNNSYTFIGDFRVENKREVQIFTHPQQLSSNNPKIALIIHPIGKNHNESIIIEFNKLKSNLDITIPVL